jgi:tyrosyl-DNA phosphodiesterase 1
MVGERCLRLRFLNLHFNLYLNSFKSLHGVSQSIFQNSISMASLPKKRKLNHEESLKANNIVITIDSDTETSNRPIKTVVRSVSPPVFTRNTTQSATSANNRSNLSKIIPSPVQLTKVEGLPASVNVDTVSLEDVLGHPLIKECWAFNYLIDVDFLLSKLDPDVRDEVKVKVVHGSWKQEDRNRQFIEASVAKHKNVTAITAHMPEAFGTHHSKMLVLFRHDDLAQVVIMTANLIEQDFRMTQAAWISPLLPILKEPDNPKSTDKIGSGLRFKFDFISYLRAYQKRLQDLISQIEKYDFSEIKGALVSSIPVRQPERILNSKTNWGWPGMRQVLHEIPSKSTNPHINIQVSSIATLGVEDKYLCNTFLNALATSSTTDLASKKPCNATFKIIFPIAEEIRRTISGYECGRSIHMKTQTPQQQKQLKYLRPMLCTWSGDTGKTPEPKDTVRRAGRRRAGPHIKTYIRFTDSNMTEIEWAMVTSANLSKQAWGAETNKTGEVRICSYEIGVVVWPQLWQENEEEGAKMVPTFMKDLPDSESLQNQKSAVVGFRMPYDIPLVPYSASDEPWCVTNPDPKPDWLGRKWRG